MTDMYFASQTFLMPELEVRTTSVQGRMPNFAFLQILPAPTQTSLTDHLCLNQRSVHKRTPALPTGEYQMYLTSKICCPVYNSVSFDTCLWPLRSRLVPPSAPSPWPGVLPAWYYGCVLELSLT